jgi:hypothetical protein
LSQTKKIVRLVRVHVHRPAQFLDRIAGSVLVKIDHGEAGDRHRLIIIDV